MKTKQLTIYAMLIALTVALSLTILIPVPATNGFVTLCEAGIYTAAFLYGPTGGLVVGASSGLLIDLISGYPQWAVFFISDPRVTRICCWFFQQIFYSYVGIRAFIRKLSYDHRLWYRRLDFI